MTTIELNEEEAGILLDILESHMSDLRMEIADTDSMDFREDLKAREAFLKKLIGRLQGE